ncbi:MAG: tail fiber protein [Bryobacteraceae bacterium]|jgi:microcystin-dependent protein
MANPFVAEIRIFPFNFPPTGWAVCDGQLIPITQNTALFSLLGTTYGGDGKSNFGLPNFQGSAPMHWGQGPGLSLRDLGEAGGEQTVTLLQTEMPAHAHTALASGSSGLAGPGGNAWGAALKGHGVLYAPSGTQNVAMSPNALSIAGSSFPHNNLQPYLALNFCIAMQGVFPSRS